MLACIGWRPGLLTRDVLGELVAIGTAAGVIGALAAVPVGAAFGAQVPFGRAVLAVPAAIVLTVLAGLVPALRAARATPAEAPPSPRRVGSGSGCAGRHPWPSTTWRAPPPERSPVRLPSRWASPPSPRSPGSPSRSKGSVVGTLLGDAGSVQVRGADLVAAGVMTVIGLGCLLDILYLDLREQAARYASLQASGRRDSTLTRLIVGQAGIIGAFGAVLGAGLGLAAVAVLSPLTGQVVLVGGSHRRGRHRPNVFARAAPRPPAAYLPTAALLSQE